MKRVYLALIIFFGVLILVLGVYIYNSPAESLCNTNFTVLNLSTHQCEIYTGCSIPEGLIEYPSCKKALTPGSDCYIPLDAGCVPYPPNQELSKEGSYSSFFHLSTPLKENNTVINVKPIIIEVQNESKAEHSQNPMNSPSLGEYFIIASVNIENNSIWINTGERTWHSLAGHFVEWTLLGFNPSIDDNLNLNITFAFKTEPTDYAYEYFVKNTP